MPLLSSMPWLVNTNESTCPCDRIVLHEDKKYVVKYTVDGKMWKVRVYDGQTPIQVFQRTTIVTRTRNAPYAKCMIPIELFIDYVHPKNSTCTYMYGDIYYQQPVSVDGDKAMTRIPNACGEITRMSIIF